jgi:hypothetical protein
MRLSGEKLRRLWGLFGKPDAAWLRMFPGGHDYSRPMRETAMGFFDKYLKGIGDGSPVPEPSFETEPPEAPELYVLPEPPLNTLTMRGIAQSMFGRTAAGGTAADYFRLNGGLPCIVPTELKRLEESEGKVRCTFVSEAGLTVPAIYWPATGVVKAFVVLVTEKGKAEAAEEFGVDRLRESGIACIAIDARGLGELKGLDLRLATYLGQAPAFGMSWDITRAIAALAPETAQIAVVGRGPAAGQAALAAALIEPRIGFVAGLATLKEFAEAFREDVMQLAIQPRANYAPSLTKLRSLVKAETVWSFLGQPDPDWAGALIRWAEK